MSLLAINLVDEIEIEQWKQNHIINSHWEFSFNHAASATDNYDQFSYVILPSRTSIEVVAGTIHCNFCGAIHNFGKVELLDKIY